MTSGLAQLKKSARRAVDRVTAPIGPNHFRTALKQLTLGTDVLFFHSALGSCGYFTAGPDDVLLALRDVSGTLCAPTFTYCYPAKHDESGPLFDPATTPSRTGLLTERLRLQNGVTRSIHATHSLAALGPLSSEICRDHHQAAAPCGRNSPFERLVQRHAAILLIGVSFHAYTLFHTAEDASGSAHAYEVGTVDRLRVVDERGDVRTCLSRRQSRAPRRFKEVGDVLETVGLARRIKLGRGVMTLVPDCALVHEFLVERLNRTSDLLYATCRQNLE